MKCPKCGYEYEGTKVNCPSCGGSLARTKMNYSEEYNSVENRRKRSSKTITKGIVKDRFGEKKKEYNLDKPKKKRSVGDIIIRVVLIILGFGLVIWGIFSGFKAGKNIASNNYSASAEVI